MRSVLDHDGADWGLPGIERGVILAFAILDDVTGSIRKGELPDGAPFFFWWAWRGAGTRDVPSRRIRHRRLEALDGCGEGQRQDEVAREAYLGQHPQGCGHGDHLKWSVAHFWWFSTRG